MRSVSSAPRTGACIIVSYAIDPVTGVLTRAADITTPSSVGGVFYAQIHPTTGAIFVASSYPQIMGAPQGAAFTRYTYDAAGHLGEAQREFINNGFFVKADVQGLRFTADAGELVVMNFYDGTNYSFGQFNAPGVLFPPVATMNKTFTAPQPHTSYGFAPRPEGGPIFYFQDGSLLYSAAFSGPSFSIQSSVPALGNGTQLLPAFDGNLLLQVLGDGADALATYTVAPDLVTVTPNTHAPVDPRPTSGVLMPCPGS